MAKNPEFKPGDLIKVYVKVIEGDKTRLSPFQGVVIQIKGSGNNKTFVVRKVSAGIGVERIFPLNSPMIARIEVKKRGKVRRAKLTYLRNKKVKKLKSQEVTAPKEDVVGALEKKES
ncbi:MAG: 50S ribosomal protein L19 [bacterium]